MNGQLDQQKMVPIISKQPGPAECAKRLNPPHPAGVLNFAGILNILWESARTRPPLAASMPPGRRETRSFSKPPRLFSFFFALLASLGDVFGALGLYLGPLALDSVIFIVFIDFVPLRPRFSMIFLEFWCPPVTSTPWGIAEKT